MESILFKYTNSERPTPLMRYIMSFSSATIPIDSAKSVETTVLPEPVSTKTRFNNNDRPLKVKIISVSKDRKSTRLNSSHVAISYAVFCLKKQKLKPNHMKH